MLDVQHRRSGWRWCRCPISIRNLPGTRRGQTSASTARRSASTRWARPSRSSTRRRRSTAALVTLTDAFDASHPIQVAGFTIYDYHPENRSLTRAGGHRLFLEHRLGARSPRRSATERQRAFIEQIGMLRRTGDRAAGSRPAAVSRAVAADQHHDHRLRPRHRGDARCISRSAVAAMVNGGLAASGDADHAQRRRGAEGEPVISAVDLARDPPAPASRGRERAPAGRPTCPVICRRQDRHGREARRPAATPERAHRLLRRRLPDERSALSSCSSWSTNRSRTKPRMAMRPAAGSRRRPLDAIVQRMAPLLGIEPVIEPADDQADPLFVVRQHVGVIAVRLAALLDNDRSVQASRWQIWISGA